MEERGKRKRRRGERGRDGKLDEERGKRKRRRRGEIGREEWKLDEERGKRRRW